ncbi:MAG TPA: heavy-metal-associated domain-containing protein [Candidatus Nanopelagicaceae bacterium]|nr:heavy-metal-associated domain-containing protein [Candidatus Nanopelagicaceae bacterium]
METLVLQVERMSCTGCEQRIGTVLRRVEGVREVVADHTTGRVEVRVGPELAERSVLAGRIIAAGYAVVEDVAR